MFPRRVGRMDPCTQAQCCQRASNSHRARQAVWAAKPAPRRASLTASISGRLIAKWRTSPALVRPSSRSPSADSKPQATPSILLRRPSSRSSSSEPLPTTERTCASRRWRVRCCSPPFGRAPTARRNFRSTSRWLSASRTTRLCSTTFGASRAPRPHLRTTARSALRCSPTPSAWR
eukprot:Amastigsp_a676669_8.p2 type:complete len:176 gc:universal Amastigsp_a676669_8:182-709(+)